MQALGLIWGDVDPLCPDFEEIRTPLQSAVHEHGRFFMEFWRKRADADGFIVGRDLPSRHLSYALRNLAVLEPMDGGKDFHIRVAGTALRRRFGRDVTGSRLSEVFSHTDFNRCRMEVSTMLATATPYVVDVKICTQAQKPLHFETIGVPALAPDRKTPWAVMGVFYYDWLR